VKVLLEATETLIEDADVELVGWVHEALDAFGLPYTQLGSTFEFVPRSDDHGVFVTCVARNWVLSAFALYATEPEPEALDTYLRLGGGMDELGYTYALRPLRSTSKDSLVLLCKHRLPDAQRSAEDVAAVLDSMIAQLFVGHRELERAERRMYDG